MVPERDVTVVDLAEPISQEAFGELVGVSQPAVSDMMSRGVIAAGEPAGAWLLAYCKHLREQAAGRGADGELASERARLAREQADAVAMKNAVARREYAPVGVIEEILAHVARQIAVVMEGLPPRIARACPELPPAAVNLVATEVARARQLAAGMNLQTLEEAQHIEDED